MSDVYLLGLGTAAPPLDVSQEASASFANQITRYTTQEARRMELLYQKTRIQRRGSVLFRRQNGEGVRQAFFPPSVKEGDRGPSTGARLERYEQEAPVLAKKACIQALAQSGAQVSEITHLVTVSCTGFSAPGVDIRLIKELRLSSQVERAHIGFMGCHGALNGLRVARALAAQPGAKVLLCAVELCSLHFHYGGEGQAVLANALFADGAAACVVGQAAPEATSGLKLAATGACLLPDSEEAMGWKIGDYGFEMKLDPSVPGLIAGQLRPWLTQWLGRQGTEPARIGSWAVHPGGPRILESVVSGLDLPQGSLDASLQVLARHGNMSSPTLLFILQELLLRQAPPPYLALAFGPGLAVEAALLV